MILSEYQEQCLYFEWLALAHPEIYAVSWSHADGAYYGGNEKERFSMAAKIKRAGGKKGVPDIGVNVARDKYHGLYIELKRKIGGAVSAEQKEMLKLLTAQGYVAVVCWGFEHAKYVTDKYLSL